MRETSQVALNFFLILLIVFISCILQISTFFPRSFSFIHYIPAPLLWLPPIVYLCIYRKPKEGIISIYLLIYAISHLTIQSTGALVFSSLLLFCFCQILKVRIFWPGPRYFVGVCAIAVLFFQLSNATLHLIFESHFPLAKEIFFWFVQALITPIFGYIQYFLLSQTDKFTDKTPLTEASLEATS